ncbi:MAG: aldehyde ferredoxin oxidoreductase family protein [Promethearchaeota archaeon]
MKNGYFGKILDINLSNESFQEIELSEDYYRQYYGGYGLACRLLYEKMPSKVSALSPEAIFGFFPGLFTSSMVPFTGRYMIAGKSPLTGTWGDSNSGGYFGPEIRKCGYDGILIEGAANNPKYISIIDDAIELLDATDLWGLDCIETEGKLKNKHGAVKIACIGPPGENLSLISGIVNDMGRIAGRSGFGAVMGSKKLKALVLKGYKKLQIADRKSLNALVSDYNKGITTDKPSIQSLRTFGTTAGNVYSGKIGDSPVKNWGGNTDDDFPVERLQKISGKEILKYKQKDYGCFSCPVHCGAIIKVDELGIEEMHLPEYETCAAFGSTLLNDDLMSIFKVNNLCNRNGMDTISAGITIGYALECFEHGIITKEDTDGLELTWGNSEAIVELLKKMINRDGIGDILADGCKVASEKIGKGSEKYAMHSMGQELPMHDPKIYSSLGSTYAFDPTPGRHTAASLEWYAGGPIVDGKLFEGFTLPKDFKKLGNDRFEAMKKIAGLYQTSSSLGLCWFSWMTGESYPLVKFLKAVTGWDISMDELIKSGLRIQALRQAFTLREGIKILDNKIPGRTIGDPPFENGPTKGKTIDYITEYKGYCEKMGWNPENGVPLKDTLIDLNLNFVIKDFNF